MRCATSRTARDNSWRCACDMAQSNNTSQDEGRDQGIPPILLGVAALVAAVTCTRGQVDAVKRRGTRNES